jgi:putative transcriptional regulator
MFKRDIGLEILEGIRDIKAHKAGVKVLRTHSLKEPAPPQEIRAKLHLSQGAFAGSS